MTTGELDGIYKERNRLVAALTKHFPSHYAIDETVEPEWRYVICVHLPTGQATWHIPESEYETFAHLRAAEPQPATSGTGGAGSGPAKHA